MLMLTSKGKETMANSSSNRPMDKATVDVLNDVTNKVNANNQKLLGQQFASYTKAMNTTYTNAVSNNIPNYNGIQGINLPTVVWDGAQEITPSPKIDMEKDIYKNEFEECGSVEIGNGTLKEQPSPACFIGLIDEVSQDEDDLYTKLPDGEIISFKGHKEQISVEIDTWNNLIRSDLLGDEVKKAATCTIYIDGRIGRIIEGTDIQDLLMKADRAIDELKVMPFSIARDQFNLVGKEIYYDNQPAIIYNIDEENNCIHIIPDTNYLSNFHPPAYALEDDEVDEWIANFGQGMLIRDYDDKIWWWRNTVSTKNPNTDPTTDPYYKQFPQPLPSPSPYPLTNPNYPYTPGITGVPGISPWVVTNPYPVITTTPYTDTDTITWTVTNPIVPENAVYQYIDPITGATTITYNDAYITYNDAYNGGLRTDTVTAKEKAEATTPQDLDKIIKNGGSSYNRKFPTLGKYNKVAKKIPPKEIKEKLEPNCLQCGKTGTHLEECEGEWDF
jgi:hypothetical protein